VVASSAQQNEPWLYHVASGMECSFRRRME
jgi:hypothetical protein